VARLARFTAIQFELLVDLSTAPDRYRASVASRPPETAVREPAGNRERTGHRERLIDAMAESIQEKGYRETTVADVVRIARTSRRTFYEQFEDREACFLALFDATNDQTMDEIAAAVSPDRSLDEQVDGALDAYIANIAGHPDLYRSFVRELPGLGQAGANRQLAVIERFARLLVELVDFGRSAQPELAARPLSMDTAIMIVGGLRELAVISLQQGRDVRELRASAGDTVKAILRGALL
jgi:AcrR family transcriptional regulator